MGFSEIGKTFTIEFILEVLKGKSIVEDISVSDGGRCLTDHLEADPSVSKELDDKIYSHVNTYFLVVGTAAAVAAAAKAATAAIVIFIASDC